MGRSVELSMLIANGSKPPAGRVPPSVDIICTKMSQSLEVVMKWQEISAPSRFSVGGGDLRKLTNRVHKQPVNFMIIIHQSLMTAKEGQKLCGIGLTALRAMFKEDCHSEQDRTHFTTESLEVIKKSVSHLQGHTNGIQEKFRLLRVTVGDVHRQLDKLTSEKDRSAFLNRLSRHLNKEIIACENVLRKIYDDLGEIEESLDLIVRWWQRIESEARNLKHHGESSLLNEMNTVAIQEVGCGFTTLEGYFGQYVEKMSLLYDNHIGNLSDDHRKYLARVRDCPNLVSEGGQLKRAK